MLKKINTYVGYDGEKHTEELWFHLNKMEMVKLAQKSEGIAKWANDVGSTLDPDGGVPVDDLIKLADAFEMFVDAAYGVRKDDQHFYKSEELLNAWKATAGYAEFIYSMFSKPEETSEFLTGLIDRELVAKAVAEQKKASEGTIGDLNVYDATKLETGMLVSNNIQVNETPISQEEMQEAIEMYKKTRRDLA